MIPIKRKAKFDKVSLRGAVYATIAALGIAYELIFAKEIRPLLIIMYGIVIAFGFYYIWFLEERP